MTDVHLETGLENDLLWSLTWARNKIIECLKACPQQLTYARRWNYFKPMRTLVVVGGVGGNPSEKKNDNCVDLIASA